MMIRVDDEKLASELLSLLRSGGLIAYRGASAGTLEVLDPAARSTESTRIAVLLTRWRARHPETQLAISR
jgi:hypothetical protein